MGLVAPNCSQSPPSRSLQREFDSEPSNGMQHSAVLQPTGSQGLSLNSQPQFKPTAKKSQVGSNLTRIRIASTSPVVWKVWLQFSSALQAYSTVLQHMMQRQYTDEHAERFLNQYAATTLMRYMTSALQFLQLCSAMHVPIDEMAEAQRVPGENIRWVRTKMLHHHKSLRWAC